METITNLLKEVKIDISLSPSEDYLKEQLKIAQHITVSVELITPEIASRYLNKNTSNRNLNKKAILDYSNQMKTNKWKLTHQGIAFDADDILQDAQHRLEAIIASNKPQYFLVFKNMPKDNFAYLDNNRTRKSGDIVKIGGISENPDVQASIAAFLLKYSNNQKGGAINNNSIKHNNLNNRDILDFVKNNPSIKEASIEAIKTFKNYKFRFINKGTLGAFYFYFSKIDKKKADDFFNLYNTGANMGPDHPILLLRNELTNGNQGKRKMINNEKVALFIKAWNYFVQDVVSITKKLKWNVDEIIPEIQDNNGIKCESRINKSIVIK